MLRSFHQFMEAKVKEAILAEKNWLKGAINPEHEGFCSPMSKPTCTPKRKALAKRFKKGGDLHKKKGKKKK